MSKKGSYLGGGSIVGPGGFNTRDTASGTPWSKIRRFRKATREKFLRSYLEAEKHGIALSLEAIMSSKHLRPEIARLGGLERWAKSQPLYAVTKHEVDHAIVKTVNSKEQIVERRLRRAEDELVRKETHERKMIDQKLKKLPTMQHMELYILRSVVDAQLSGKGIPEIPQRWQLVFQSIFAKSGGMLGWAESHSEYQAVKEQKLRLIEYTNSRMVSNPSKTSIKKQNTHTKVFLKRGRKILIRPPSD